MGLPTGNMYELISKNFNPENTIFFNAQKSRVDQINTYIKAQDIEVVPAHPILH